MVLLLVGLLVGATLGVLFTALVASPAPAPDCDRCCLAPTRKAPTSRQARSTVALQTPVGEPQSLQR